HLNLMIFTKIIRGFISAQLQNAHRYRKGLPTWGDEVRLCWEVDSCVVLTV
ncbi:TOBE domain-containing protein, partial [Escherichia coli]|nr:TOBE domain-containing protein [Escherichia coli]